MSELKDTILADMKTAMKARDKDTLAALRQLKAALQSEETSGSKHELTDDDILRALRACRGCRRRGLRRRRPLHEGHGPGHEGRQGEGRRRRRRAPPFRGREGEAAGLAVVSRQVVNAARGTTTAGDSRENTRGKAVPVLVWG